MAYESCIMHENAQGWIVYQPLIVGLGAVVLGLLANSALEWFKQHLAQRNDARALRAALIAELTANLESLRDRLPERHERPSPTSMLMVPLNSHTKVYDTAVNRLGLLTEIQITQVIMCYDFLVNGPRNFSMNGEIRGTIEYPWVEVGPEYKPVITGMDQHCIELINSAISALRA